MSGGIAEAAHLARRFFASLWPGGPSREVEDEVAGVLLPGELALWRQMSGPDRRHAAGVRLRTTAQLGVDVDRAVQAAALLHDVGKVASHLGTVARVVATLVARGGRAPRRGRIAAYLRHGPIGAELLRAAGSDPLTAAWAGEHHLPRERWTVPAHVGRALKDADDD